MAKTMTPSKPMTDGQIDKATAAYRAMLVKRREEIGCSELVQLVLGNDDYINEQVGVLRRHVEAVSNLIVRKVPVNRNRSQQEALDATNRAQYTDRKVVDAMPKGEGDEAEVVFFKPDLSQRNGFISDDDLEKEFELRGLKPADPISVAAINEANPAFADEKPHGTHWKDAKGNWCYAAFRRWFDRRRVVVSRSGRGWHDRWWFAGVRK